MSVWHLLLLRGREGRAQKGADRTRRQRETAAAHRARQLLTERALGAKHLVDVKGGELVGGEGTVVDRELRARLGTQKLRECQQQTKMCNKKLSMIRGSAEALKRHR